MLRTAENQRGFARQVARNVALRGGLLMALAAAYLIPHELVAAHADSLLGVQTATTTVETSAAESAAQRKLERLMRKHQCSRTGLGPEVIPAAAVVVAYEVDGTDVVTIAAEAKVTTFAKGWAIAEGRRPGTLVAVCARPAVNPEDR